MSEPKERPINFNGEMIRAYMRGKKWQTRRVIDPQPLWVASPHVPFKTPDADPKGIINCKYGKPGDRLWFRETHQFVDKAFCGNDLEDPVYVAYRADGQARLFNTDNPKFEGTVLDAYGMHFDGPWRPSIFMHRWASRFTTTVRSVRVERVQDISAEDIIAEGLSTHLRGHDACVILRSKFAEFWDRINGKRGWGWDQNPWVFAIEFDPYEGEGASDDIN